MLAAGCAAFAPSTGAKLALQRSHTTPLSNIRVAELDTKAALYKRAADAVIAYDKAEAKAALASLYASHCSTIGLTSSTSWK